MDVSSGADFAGVGGLLGPPRVTALGGLSGRLYAQPVITIYGVCCACKTLPVVYRPTSIHRVTHRLVCGSGHCAGRTHGAGGAPFQLRGRCGRRGRGVARHRATARRGRPQPRHAGCQGMHGPGARAHRSTTRLRPLEHAGAPGLDAGKTLL